MVSIAVMGGVEPTWVTYERQAVEACLHQLQHHGYFMPDLSYFGIKQLEVGKSNVIQTAKTLYHLNQQNMDLPYGSTYAIVSFWVILDQVLEKLDVVYMAGESFFTRSLRFQAKLIFYRINQLNTPLFDIYIRECDYHWKAEESAPVRALDYFDEVLGWTIGDLNYLSYLQKQRGLRYYPAGVEFFGARRRLTESAGDVDDDPVRIIRAAVAEALVSYYPLAGCLVELPPVTGGKLLVDCTAEGVVFVEAEADVRLEELGQTLAMPYPCVEELLCYDIGVSLRTPSLPSHCSSSRFSGKDGFAIGYR
ncbi:hypothetical protein C2845_PM17G08000 [Panicum miliaceum]|uniref:Uncharacterized protein n=1 Tax=Panicum miliaceum TaxID=4540 RepID=A0A3L6Q6C5_PANMI|nr:hypothetical protein C2845_PM17G08000 [Panicum miliaceum]